MAYYDPYKKYLKPPPRQMCITSNHHPFDEWIRRDAGTPKNGQIFWQLLYP